MDNRQEARDEAPFESHQTEVGSQDYPNDKEYLLQLKKQWVNTSVLLTGAIIIGLLLTGYYEYAVQAFQLSKLFSIWFVGLMIGDALKFFINGMHYVFAVEDIRPRQTVSPAPVNPLATGDTPRIYGIIDDDENYTYSNNIPAPTVPQMSANLYSTLRNNSPVLPSQFMDPPTLNRRLFSVPEQQDIRGVHARPAGSYRTDEYFR